MEFLIYTFIVLLVLLVVYSAALVSYHTARSDFFEKKQKIIIIAIAWLVPLIGPAFILTVLNEDKPRVRIPGIPLLDLIFLTAVFTQNTDSSLENLSSMDNDVSNYSDGSDAGGDT